jgi:acyl-ACP thioesterase
VSRAEPTAPRPARPADTVPGRRAAKQEGGLEPFPDPPPSGSRTVAANRRVRLGDVDTSGRLRLDAAARYLQDIAADDVRDAGVEGEHRWVVRRTSLVVSERPSYDELVCVVTWCSGVGAAWAERRTTITGPDGSLVQASALWVALDPVSLRPAPLGQRFEARYGAAAAGRLVGARLVLDPTPPAATPARSFPLRRADFDPLGHVNNAVAWALVDEEAGYSLSRPLRRATVEYRAPIDAPPDIGGQATLGVHTANVEDGLALWVTGPDGVVAVAARASVDPPAGP